MTVRAYYRNVLWLPIVVPLLVIAYRRIAGPDSLGDLGLAITYSFVFAGVPYVVSALILRYWMRTRSDRAIRTAISVFPLLAAPVLVLGSWLMVAVRERAVSNLAADPSGAGSLAVLALVLGYGYVVIMLLVEAALRASRVIHPTSEVTP